MKINEKLSRLRNKAGLTQDEFGDIIYSSAAYVSKYEKGWFRPPRDIIDLVADWFCIDRDTFADESNDIYLPEGGLPKPKSQKGKGRRPTQPTQERLISERCNTCFYRISISDVTKGCQYYLATGSRRECPPGDSCDKYKKDDGHRRKPIFDIYFNDDDFWRDENNV